MDRSLWIGRYDPAVMSRLVLNIYSALMRLVQPLLRRKLARRAVAERGYGVAVNERFGHYTQAAEPSPELVWLHAVSLGETRAAAMLLARLRAEYPFLRVLLTHGTATGRAEGKTLLRPGDVQVWQPWDTHAVTQKFLTHFKPRLGVLIETEVWPCAVAAAVQRNMPLVVVNGRLSEKSLQRALRLSVLARPAYAGLAAVYAQTEADAQRYLQLGATQVRAFGNLKFDAAPSAAQQALGQTWRRELAQPVVMLASSREGEEVQFIEQIRAVAQQTRAQAAIDSVAFSLVADSLAADSSVINIPVAVKPIKWLIVPRHPQRFDDVAALLTRSGLTVSRRSAWQGSPLDSSEALQADVWLGDSLGEMALYYALSDAALLGGSFEALGGHNLIEAAAGGCPVVMGLHTFNFAEAADNALAAGAALRVVDMAAGVRAAAQLVSAAGAQASMSQAAAAFSGSHQGAAERYARALAQYLRPGQ